MFCSEGRVGSGQWPFGSEEERLIALVDRPVHEKVAKRAGQIVGWSSTHGPHASVANLPPEGPNWQKFHVGPRPQLRDAAPGGPAFGSVP
ncbi:MAG TPA: hypothetical protein VFW09_08405, partial [Solirubrobacteraceae bacterium]|nr:hypothetical protein [Solirubrobacteraceae bacterium]